MGTHENHHVESQFNHMFQWECGVSRGFRSTKADIGVPGFVPLTPKTNAFGTKGWVFSFGEPGFPINWPEKRGRVPRPSGFQVFWGRPGLLVREVTKGKAKKGNASDHNEWACLGSFQNPPGYLFRYFWVGDKPPRRDRRPPPHTQKGSINISGFPFGVPLNQPRKGVT